jgi:hypothetical protein
MTERGKKISAGRKKAAAARRRSAGATKARETRRLRAAEKLHEDANRMLKNSEPAPFLKSASRQEPMSEEDRQLAKSLHHAAAYGQQSALADQLNAQMIGYPSAQRMAALTPKQLDTYASRCAGHTRNYLRSMRDELDQVAKSLLGITIQEL